MFTAQGYGVIIGEYSVFPLDSTTLKDGALEYFENFLCNCDQYNICPMLWDTNTLFKKDGTGFWNSDLAKIFKDYSYDAQKDIAEADLVAAAKAKKEELKENASTAFKLGENEAMAWLMYNSSDWTTMYCSQDKYDPSQCSVGVVATDVYVTGEGTYTVALDFTGTAGGYANGVVFSAVGIDNGELLYPGYYMEITSVKINGEEYELTGQYYTTSDNQDTTRVNLYNSWVTKIPEDAHCKGDIAYATPCVIEENIGNVKTIEVTFEYIAP